MPTRSKEELLNALASAGREGRSAEVRELARAVRPLWENWVEEEEKRGGDAAVRALLLEMFRLGVFDEPPLTGAPYDAWLALRRTDPEEDVFVAEDGEPLFSLLMPVYNPRPEFLDAALWSVRRQTCGRWELCAADDCSTDPEVGETLRRHAAEDGRIRAVFRKSNGHICAASNTALAEARASWCVLMDHDDVLPERALEKLSRALLLHPEALVFFFGRGSNRNSGHRQACFREKTRGPVRQPPVQAGF
jgi:cellulose synthase/poly-beta-1,6-N-acetylglucosamine synthase-like glycosyltransferase